MGHIYIRTVKFIKDNGDMIILVLVKYLIQMVIFLKVVFRMVIHMEKGLIVTQMETSILE